MAVLGDIALVGYAADAAGKSFSFVILSDLSGETINFTDNGWLAAGGFRANEGTTSYVVPAGTPIGTVITISGLTSNFNPSTSGDQILAYVGSAAAPTFLFALDFADNNSTYAGDASNSNTSAVPTGLTFGQNALAFTLDNGAYTGPLSGTRSEILANIANPANWTLDDATPVPYAPGFTVGGAGDTQVTIGDVSITEGNAGTSILTFTVTRSDATGDFSVDYASADGTATAGSDYAATSGTITFAAGGALTQTISVTINGDTVTEANEAFTLALSNLVNTSGSAAIADASATGTIINDDISVIAIHDIQGAGHVSAFAGQVVTTTGIVTAVDTNGFYIQSADTDIDGSNATSEAILVFTSTAPTVTVGDRINVTGTVTEFIPGGASSGNLSTTEIVSPVISVLSSGNALPTAIVLGAGGRSAPTEIIENDNFSVFDPESDGIDFYESLEGMIVTVPTPLVVAPTTSFGELYTVADGGTGATGLSARGTIVTKGSVGDGLSVTNTGPGSDYNPERIQIDADSFTPGGIPLVNAGTTLNDVTGIMSYAFGSYEVLATSAVTVAVPSILTGEVTNLAASADTLTIASYNVLNLDPNDSDGDTDVADGRFTSIALQIKNALGSPDIIALQEIQDNSGSTNDGTVSASMTLQMLVDAIALAGGPVYSFIDNPFITNNTNGGEPGANIRVAYLYDASRVSLVAGSVSTTPDAAADFAGSRQPLVATFAFNDENVTLINNHFSSKGGSTSLFGATQPSINGSAAERLIQAQNVADYVRSLGADTNVVVLGDLNEFTNEESLAPLGAAGLNAMSLTLAETERYSYSFEGNAQELDQVYVSGNLTSVATLDIVHVNSEFLQTATSASDHDPSVLALDFAASPSLAAGDIAFIGFNADGNDDLAFVALTAIAAGTVIYFNDQEWQGAAFNTGEGQVTWTATSDIAAGTIVTINSFSSAPVSNFGTTTGSSGLGSDGEIIYAYVGAAFAPTAFLAAIANDGFAVSGGTLAGTGLVVGQTAIDLSNGGTNPGEDVAIFNGARNGATSYADYLAAINNPANWLTQDGTGDQSLDGIGPDLPFNLSGFTIGTVETQTVGFQNTGVSIAEGNAGTTAYTFTVARNGGTTGQVDFTGSFAPGTTDAADYASGTPPTSFSGSIAAGATSATITITVAGDTLVEANENFGLTLTGVTNSVAIPVTLGANATATGTIVNDDFPLAIGGINVYDAASSLAGSTATPVASDDIVLVRMGSIAGTVAGAESIAYAGGRVYATNIAGNAINVHTVTAAGALVNETPILLSALPSYLPGGVNSVDIKNGIIAVGYENINPALAGFVALFNAADNSLIKTIQVGVLPDDVTFTPDGTKLLVANEGESLSAQGTISIIDLSGGAAAATVTNTISFASLNGAEEALRDRGLAIAPGQPAAGDIEPEYITISADGTRAYVTLQEVNGVAVIDLTDPTADKPLSIQPLGTIDRNLAGNALDTSDQDGGINIRNVDIQSLLQPDAIASFDVGGATYFVTANEGDARVNITDSVRLGSAGYVLDPVLFPNAAAMKANADLGRLNVLTTVGDTDGDGDFDVIHTLGGRGISIFKQEADGSITKVRETGGEFEAIIAANNPTIFNSNQSTAASSVDTRSDDKGPEPEGVTIGVVNGRTYAFVGLERVGGYMVYDVTDPANAVFVTYKPQTGADLGPETSAFVSAANSPTGQALLLSGQEISNTVTLYSIQTQSEGDDVINGGVDADRFNGRGGHDVINGNGGDDIIDGGAGNDILRGGDGIDTASYASAVAGVTVTLATALPQDTGGAGTDTLSGFENLLGSAFDDLLYGDMGNNSIEGGAGNDVIIAARGNDTLSGGAGINVLQGGVGADIFSFETVDNGAIDIITDFSANNGDSVFFGAGVSVTDVKFAFLSTEASVNGFDVANGARSIDLLLTLSSAAGTQQVQVLDAYGFANNSYWENVLGVDLTYAVPQPIGSEQIHIA